MSKIASFIKKVTTRFLPADQSGKFKAICHVEFQDNLPFRFMSVKVMDGKDGSLYVALPGKRGNLDKSRFYADLTLSETLKAELEKKTLDSFRLARTNAQRRAAKQEAAATA